MLNNLEKFGKCLCQGARLMIGIPDYDTYVNHMKINHPDQPIMDYKDFFRDRQEARYGSKTGFRCC